MASPPPIGNVFATAGEDTRLNSRGGDAPTPNLNGSLPIISHFQSDPNKYGTRLKRIRNQIPLRKFLPPFLKTAFQNEIFPPSYGDSFPMYGVFSKLNGEISLSNGVISHQFCYKAPLYGDFIHQNGNIYRKNCINLPGNGDITPVSSCVCPRIGHSHVANWKTCPLHPPTQDPTSLSPVFYPVSPAWFAGAY